MNEYFNLFILTTIKETNNIPAAFLSSWQIFYYFDKIIFNNQTILYIILDVEEFNYDLPARKTTTYVAKIFRDKVFPVAFMYNLFEYAIKRMGPGPTPELAQVSLKMDSDISSHWVIFSRFSKRMPLQLEDTLNLSWTEGHESTKVRGLLSSRVVNKLSRNWVPT